jgi:hypothetical protein
MQVLRALLCAGSCAGYVAGERCSHNAVLGAVPDYWRGSGTWCTKAGRSTTMTPPTRASTADMPESHGVMPEEGLEPPTRGL